jgi:hypothetical protein
MTGSPGRGSLPVFFIGLLNIWRCKVLIDKSKVYTTLNGLEIDLSQMDDLELKFLRHLERRSMLEGMTYLEYMKAVTQWKNPAYKGRTPAEIADCPVYQIAEDLGLRLGIRTGEMTNDNGESLSNEELLDMMRPEGIMSKLKVHQVKRKLKKEKKNEQR